ncbi:MAG: cytochrome c [Pseudaminobacter sp.]
MTFQAKALIVSIAAGIVSGAAFAADRESEFRGRRIAETNCAVCHAISLHDASEDPAAPAFRTLGMLRPFAELRRELAGDLFRRHPEMPDFEPTREQIDDIVDFIESIQD